MGAVAAGEEFNADGGRRWRSTSQNWPGEWVGIDELGIDAKVRETRGEGIRTSRCRKFELSRAGVTWLLLLSSSFPLLPFFSSLFFRVISWPQRTLCCKSLLLRDPEQPSLVHIGQYSVLLPAVVWTTTVRPVRSKLVLSYAVSASWFRLLLESTALPKGDVTNWQSLIYIFYFQVLLMFVHIVDSCKSILSQCFQRSLLSVSWAVNRRLEASICIHLLTYIFTFISP